jgi:hypothetical protein
MAKSLDIIDPKRELGDDSQENEKFEKDDRVVRASENEEHSGGGLFYLIIGIIAVIVSASLALYILFKDDNSSKNGGGAASATSTVSPSGTATSSAATSSASSTTSPAAATTTTTSSAFKYSNEQIRIANGNSTSGEAARIKTLLEGKGYKIASVGNATKQYSSSFVYYKTGQEKLANALKTDLAGEYVATVEKSDEIVGTYDAVIVLGAK